MSERELFFRVLVAVAAGLLIGMERGWKNREAESGRRIAGIRTFALIALLGSGWGLLLDESRLLPLISGYRATIKPVLVAPLCAIRSK